MSVIKVSESLKRIRKNVGMTQKEVYECLGVAQSTYSSWETGKAEPDMSTLANICKILGVSINEFFNQYTNQTNNIINLALHLAPNEQVFIKRYRTLDGFGKRAVEALVNIEYERVTNIATEVETKSVPNQTEQEEQKTVSLKVYSQKASAGLGNYLYDDDSYDIMDFSEDEVPKKAAFGIKITGDSMEPKIHHGQIVFVEPTPRLNDGEIGIFVYNGEAYCKKLHINYEKETISLISLNKSYAPRPIPDPESLQTVGKVLL